mmetsp:Transcript_24110/g.35675  ORF Transcript_24110/g.35675 Transcript_24110/m.35675 type:complete len:1074 (+) Transcript_24110:1710-4931(+)
MEESFITVGSSPCPKEDFLGNPKIVEHINSCDSVKNGTVSSFVTTNPTIPPNTSKHTKSSSSSSLSLNTNPLPLLKLLSLTTKISRTEAILEMSPQIVGWVIGKGGQRIRDLMEESSAKIWIDQDCMTPAQYRVVYVSGLKNSVDLAVKRMQELVERAPIGQQQLQQQQAPPKREGGGGLGGASASTGSTVASTSSSATVHLPPLTSPAAVVGNTSVGLGYSAVASAPPPIVATKLGTALPLDTHPMPHHLSQHHHHSVPQPDITTSSSIGVGGGRATHEMTCEPRFVPLLIGRRGWTVKHIQDASGARVDIDQTVTPRKITVSGTIKSVKDAVRMVSDVLSYPHAQLHYNGGSGGGEERDITEGGEIVSTLPSEIQSDPAKVMGFAPPPTAVLDGEALFNAALASSSRGNGTHMNHGEEEVPPTLATEKHGNATKTTTPAVVATNTTTTTNLYYNKKKTTTTTTTSPSSSLSSTPDLSSTYLHTVSSSIPSASSVVPQLEHLVEGQTMTTTTMTPPKPHLYSMSSNTSSIGSGSNHSHPISHVASSSSQGGMNAGRVIVNNTVMPTGSHNHHHHHQHQQRFDKNVVSNSGYATAAPSSNPISYPFAIQQQRQTHIANEGGSQYVTAHHHPQQQQRHLQMHTTPTVESVMGASSSMYASSSPAAVNAPTSASLGHYSLSCINGSTASSSAMSQQHHPHQQINSGVMPHSFHHQQHPPPPSSRNVPVSLGHVARGVGLGGPPPPSEGNNFGYDSLSSLPQQQHHHSQQQHNHHHQSLLMQSNPPPRPTTTHLDPSNQTQFLGVGQQQEQQRHQQHQHPFTSGRTSTAVAPTGILPSIVNHPNHGWGYNYGNNPKTDEGNTNLSNYLRSTSTNSGSNLNMTMGLSTTTAEEKGLARSSSLMSYNLDTILPLTENDNSIINANENHLIENDTSALSSSYHSDFGKSSGLYDILGDDSTFIDNMFGPSTASMEGGGDGTADFLHHFEGMSLATDHSSKLGGDGIGKMSTDAASSGGGIGGWNSSAASTPTWSRLGAISGLNNSTLDQPLSSSSSAQQQQQQQPQHDRGLGGVMLDPH